MFEEEFNALLVMAVSGKECAELLDEEWLRPAEAVVGAADVDHGNKSDA